MTLFLASVTGADEALTALAHGADIIDLKDVSTNALAGRPVADVCAVVEAVAGRRPVSAVAGMPGMAARDMAAAADAVAAAGADFVKLALPPAPHAAETVRGLAALARRVKLVGVLFVDMKHDDMERDDTLVALMAQCGFYGVMLDTARKDAGRLLDHVDIAALSRFVAAARAHELAVGLAGSLEAPDIPRLLLLAPDILGFRGALCAGGRDGRIEPAAVTVIRELIPTARSRTPASTVGAFAPATRQPRGKEAATDRLFVHDFVLPMRIGAYVHEHARTQLVRFNVDACVTRPTHATDMRDVLSYDLITDGIRIITAREHIALVEDLAERIASFVLAYPQVVDVTIRIEKLEIGPGSVGIEIIRRRPPEVAKVHHLFPAALGGVRAAE
jgi:dihydroneopterin aldolase